MFRSAAQADDALPAHGRRVAARHVADPELSATAGGRQVIWACVLGLIGTAGIAVPTHRSYSTPTARPLVAEQRVTPEIRSYVAPVATRFVTADMLLQTADGLVRCEVVPGNGNPTRVDCAMLQTSQVTSPPGGDACGEAWGTTVRLAGSARLTCSAPLPTTNVVTIPARTMVRTADTECVNGPAGLRCVNTPTAAGFRVTRQGITLIAPAGDAA